MKKDEIKFTVRLNRDVAAKLAYIADYYGRSQNRQINWLVRQCVSAFEKEHGKIELDASQ